MPADNPNPLPQFVITMEGDILGQDTPENRDLVRRIHACVNACEGISTEELERGIIKDMCQVMGQVIPILQQKVA
ncbi:MAG: hypothetical protein R3C12_07330 [Planctomycetaceae bacterium]|nr:hypothetical protein [Planctomycetaceae bacterium]